MTIEEKINSFQTVIAERGRLIGFDHGERRVGLAITDTLRTVATPHSVIAGKPPNKTFASIDSVIENTDIAGMVVGLPLHMNGQESERSRQARRFALQIFERYQYPVLLFDERLTTATVERMLRQEADLSRQKRKKHRDKLAACILLQALCDALTKSI